MKTISVGEFKSRFSEILEWIQKGEDVVISFGRKKKEVAVLMDIRKFPKQQKRTLGLLQGKARAVFANDFKMTEEELLGK